MDLMKLKNELLQETLIRIEKKKSQDKKYVKLELFASKYFIFEGMNESQMLKVTELVIQDLLDLGYNIDIDKNQIYWGIE